MSKNCRFASSNKPSSVFLTKKIKLFINCLKPFNTDLYICAVAKIDLNKGINLKIEGEIGKFQTIPVDTLAKIGQRFQDLVLTLAKHDLAADEAIDLNNFKLELSDFNKGSAVPQFSFTNRIQTTISDYKNQRNLINEKLTELLEVADTGDYLSIKKMYKKKLSRNEVTHRLYDLVNSFGDSPVAIVGGGKTMKRLFKIQKFKPNVKNKLIEKPNVVAEEKIEENTVGSIKVVREGGKVVRKKVVEIYDDGNTTLSYSTDKIEHEGRVYEINHPLRCLFLKDGNYYIIQNELLDLIGTGNTQEEAEQNFFKAFDYSYMRFNNPKVKLNKRLTAVRDILRVIVKSVKQKK